MCAFHLAAFRTGVLQRTKRGCPESCPGVCVCCVCVSLVRELNISLSPRMCVCASMKYSDASAHAFPSCVFSQDVLDRRLVCVCGPEGIGKSVVAGAVSQFLALRRRFPAGVYFAHLGVRLCACADCNTIHTHTHTHTHTRALRLSHAVVYLPRARYSA